MKISIIVPMYKVENYIEKCLDSIVNQTYKEFELILVNDKSPDNSLNVAKSFFENHSFTNYIIIDKVKNEGVAAARNSGIDIAKGEYVLFVDSDDYLEYDMLEHLISKFTNDDIDIVVCNAYRISNDLTFRSNFFTSPIKGKISGLEAARSVLRFNEKNYFFRCLIDRSLFINHEFPRDVFYEDALILPIIFSKARNLYFIENELYAYRDNPNSTTNNLGNIDFYWLVPDCLDDLLEYFKSYRNGVLYIDAISYSYTWIRNLSLWCVSRERNFSIIRKLMIKYSSFLNPTFLLSNKNIITDIKLMMQLLILKSSSKLFWYQFSKSK